MRPCLINKMPVGGAAPVRLMGVINCSPESFYTDSFVPTNEIHKKAVEMIEQGADMVDIGARSTAPNAQAISGSEEGSRMEAALKELDGSGITVSVDTMHPGVLDICLRHEIHAINDIAGLMSPAYAKKAGDSGLPAFVMASRAQPGDAVGVDETRAALELVMRRCEEAGVNEYVLDPGIGMWTPSRSPDNDWDLCRHFETFQVFDRPLLAAVSRKTFIGELLKREPIDRLYGSIGVTMMLLEKGACIVRTHDVKETKDAIRVFERMGKTP
ncbi:MAG: dihydropteroate synthase [Methanoregula sp.]